MLRQTRTALLAATAALLPAPAFAQEATTTRIETRAFYGATVTLEAGVRVFRPLPPHSKVIINPGGATPLHVGHEEYRATTRNYNYNYDQGGNGADQGPAYDNGYNAYGAPVYGNNYGRNGYNHGNRVQRRNPHELGFARRGPPQARPSAAKPPTGPGPMGGGGGSGKH